jgi:uncharacterized protein
MDWLFTSIFGLIVLAASVLGAMAGIGGGVIIRPALDAFNYFSDPVIPNMMSAFCVLAVALTSVTKHAINKTKFDIKSTVFLGLGAVVGGILGGMLFDYIKKVAGNNALITLIQSIVLIILLTLVVIYMLTMKGKEKYTFHIKNWIITVLIGLLLGLFSSFLGIGGGPINVAVLLLFFGMNMKDASVGSLVIIIFSQSSKIIQSLIKNQLQTSFQPANWGMLGVLVVVAIVGSLTGTFLNKKVPEKALSWVYIITMFGIIALNIYNVVIYSMALVA